MSRFSAMEKDGDNMLFPCKFSISGCESMLKYKEKESHENEECNFRLLSCPFRFVNCCVVNFSGDSNELLAHLVENHDSRIKQFTDENLPLRCRAPPPLSVPFNSMVNSIVGFDNNDFVVNSYSFHNKVIYIHFMTVQLMGSNAEAENYTYSITLKGSGQQLSFRGKCFSLHKEVMSIYESRECLNFDAATALKFHHPYKQGEEKDKIFRICLKLFKSEEPPKSKVKSPIKRTATEEKDIKMQRVTRAAKMSPPVTRGRKRKC